MATPLRNIGCLTARLDWSLTIYLATVAWNKHDENWEAGAGVEITIPSNRRILKHIGS